MDDLGPLCVGIDPHPALLTSWGLPDDVAGLRRFALTVVDALAGKVAALKPQSALLLKPLPHCADQQVFWAPRCRGTVRLARFNLTATAVREVGDPAWLYHRLSLIHI